MKRSRLAGRLACVAVFVASLHAAYSALAHPILMTYIEHRAGTSVGPVNIDITVELTFFEVRSMTERRRMDADRDGAITAAEVREYLTRIGPSLESAVTLSVGDRPADVAPLYEPEIDLLGVNEVATCHHVLRLFYFARTPEWLKARDEIVITDNLWPHAAAICSPVVTGREGFRVTA